MSDVVAFLLGFGVNAAAFLLGFSVTIAVLVALNILREVDNED